MDSDYSARLLVVQNFYTKFLNIVVIDNFDLDILKLNIGFVIFGSFLPLKFSQQPHHHFLLDKDKLNAYAKFDPNILCGSKVVSIFNN